MMNLLNTKSKLSYLLFLGMMCCSCFLGSCKDDDVIDPDTPSVSESGTAVENINTNVKALRRLIEAKQQELTVKTYNPVNNGASYAIELSDGTGFSMYAQIAALGGGGETIVYSPKLGARIEHDEYYWTIDDAWLTFENDEKVKVVDENNRDTPIVGINADGYWTVKYGTKSRTLDKAESGRLTSQFEQVSAVGDELVRFIFTDQTPVIELHLFEGDKPDIPPLIGSIRRPISPEQPAWFVHIDSWNYADPQKIIDLIPADIRPYVIFNISLSVSHDETTGIFNVSEYGYEIAKSWLRTCAENNVWAMVQPSSGGFSHFKDVSLYSQFEGDDKVRVYDEFFREYPNFLGFNYCEQFWGYDDQFSVSWLQRVAHWTQLLKLTHKYGGYLVVSFCGNTWSANIDPIALVKRNPDFAQVAKLCPENFIMCEKYTTQTGFFNVESMCLGTWLSGFAGQYGIRFDQCGWTEEVGQNGDKDFPPAAGALPIIEHVMLTGQTIIDGPELIWQQCFTETGVVSVGNGYQSRNWECFPQFININIDMFRKIIDGTIRIPSRQEVIDRTKFVILQDVYSGDDNAQYCAPKNLYEGLYLRDDDGNLWDNKCYFKKTGRYPTIPVVFELCDEAANSFAYKINQSGFDGSWGSDIQLKIGKFNRIFPEEYTGELYAGRIENGWVIYNHLAGTRNATIPFKYNTCDKMELAFSKYTVAVVKEYADKVTFYMNNHDNGGSKKTEVIKIYGCKSTPSCEISSRANGTAQITKEWKDGVYTLTVSHNGPLDLSVNCSGNAVGRETRYTTASVSTPASPQIYQGAHQYEAECFDFKNVAKRITAGSGEAIRNYTAQGYINFGAGAEAAVRDEITAVEEGVYKFLIRYRASSATVNTVDMYVNGTKVGTPEFAQTDNDNTTWYTVSMSASLKKGKNTFELKANSSGAGDLYLDNIVVERI